MSNSKDRSLKATLTTTDENETVESEASDEEDETHDDDDDEPVDGVDKQQADVSTPGATFTLKRRIVNTRLTDYLLIFSKLPKPDVSLLQ